jgi:hypothetical protein
LTGNKIELETEKPFEVVLDPLDSSKENPDVVELDSSEKATTFDLDVETNPEKEDKQNSKNPNKKIIRPSDDEEEDQMSMF